MMRNSDARRETCLSERNKYTGLYISVAQIKGITHTQTSYTSTAVYSSTCLLVGYSGQQQARVRINVLLFPYLLLFRTF